MSALVGASGIKSIQRGTISITTAGGGAETSATATISAVNAAKSTIELLGYSASTSTAIDGAARVDLTNATTVTATAWAYGVAITVKANYQVTEYF